MVGESGVGRNGKVWHKTVLMLYASNDVARERLKKRGCNAAFIRQRLSKDDDDFGKFKLVATYSRAAKAPVSLFWTAKNDNHYDRAKILNWLDERIPE